MTLPYFELVLGFIALSYVFETYLDVRQHKNLKIKQLPKQIEKYGIITQEQFLKSQEYGLEKSNFGFYQGLFSVITNVLFLIYGGLPWMWGLSLRIIEKYGYTAEYETLQSLIFLGVMTLMSMVISLPFELYSTFVIEERHGFNKQTLSLFFTDKVKSLGLQVVFGVPIVSAALYLIKWGGPYFWFYLWVFLVIVMLIMITIYPTLIAPIFNKFEPLPDGELRDRIYSLAKQVEFPLTKLYKVDGSKRSGHSNAYFYGFFKNKRIVLYDTLLTQLDTEGIVGVLAHELGHFKMGHVYKNLAISLAHMMLMLFLFGQSQSNTDLYHAFGFYTKPALVGLTLFSYIFSPIEHVVGFLMHALARHFEYQADEFAVKLNFDISNSLMKLSNENKSSLIIDPLYSAYHHTHPTLIERINHINAMKLVHHKKQ